MIYLLVNKNTEHTKRYFSRVVPQIAALSLRAIPFRQPSDRIEITDIFDYFSDHTINTKLPQPDKINRQHVQRCP